jgi:alkylation response protein AidB-like acyl-CoA dehydrogenase
MNLHPSIAAAVREGSELPSPRKIASRLAAVEIARAIVPKLRGRAAKTEQQRRVPDVTIDELRASGLFGLVTPRRFGGSELGLAALVEVTAELASGCGSTGWVFGVLSGHNWVLGLFDPVAQREVFSDPCSLVATVIRLSGAPAQKVESGYRLADAEGRFCSGIDHSNWIIVGAPVDHGSAPRESRYFLLPRADVEVIDDWHTLGMRGTGSRSIRIRDAFVPGHRSLGFGDMVAGVTPGGKFHESALFRLPFTDVLPMSFAGAPIGMARALLHSFAEGIERKLKGLSDHQIAEQSPTLVRMAQAAADIDAASAMLITNAARFDDWRDGEPLSPHERSRISRDFAYAAQKCRSAAATLFEASGGSNIYDSSELQRAWRDVNSATCHTAFAWDVAAPNFARAMLGLPPSPFDRRGR